MSPQIHSEDPAARRARVERLRREVEAGTYEVDLAAVAEAVVRRVELAPAHRAALPRRPSDGTRRPILAVAA